MSAVETIDWSIPKVGDTVMVDVSSNPYSEIPVVKFGEVRALGDERAIVLLDTGDFMDFDTKTLRVVME